MHLFTSIQWTETDSMGQWHQRALFRPFHPHFRTSIQGLSMLPDKCGTKLFSCISISVCNCSGYVCNNLL